jgi:hypothetical protein
MGEAQAIEVLSFIDTMDEMEIVGILNFAKPISMAISTGGDTLSSLFSFLFPFTYGGRLFSRKTQGLDST